MFYKLEKIDSIHPLFQKLENCKGVEQKEKYHPEGDVFIHSLQTFYYAISESNDIDLIFAALLHDIGKQVENHGHEKHSVNLVKSYISEKTSWLILNHMKIWTLILGEMKKIKKVHELYNNKWFPDLILLARWDKMARNKYWNPKYDRVEIIEKLKNKTISYIY